MRRLASSGFLGHVSTPTYEIICFIINVILENIDKNILLTVNGIELVHHSRTQDSVPRPPFLTISLGRLILSSPTDEEMEADKAK
jgi:hypothetical protein